ncbi:hypothetical protein N9A94_09620, partial [Akkermansiaceae bacterium]|nr:hypothetical protein [Akkermansiaceae bacterium]
FYSLGNFFMSDIVEGGKTTVRYCRDNYLNAVPVFDLSPGEPHSLVRVHGYRSNGRTLVRVPSKTLERHFVKWKPGGDDSSYGDRFRKHQDFMWRYYIPIRYRLMLDPMATLSRFGLSKILRLIGRGSSPWRTQSR